MLYVAPTQLYIAFELINDAYDAVFRLTRRIGNLGRKVNIQTNATDNFVLLAKIERHVSALAKLRAAALYGALLSASLLFFAGSAHPAQPLFPWFAGGLLGCSALPLLFFSHCLLKLKQDAHRSLVRYLFRRGHRVAYPEFSRSGETPEILQAQPRA